MTYLVEHEAEIYLLGTPEDWFNPFVCDTVLIRQVLDLALLLEDVFMLHSHGGVSIPHMEMDMEFLGERCHRAAHRICEF